MKTNVLGTIVLVISGLMLGGCGGGGGGGNAPATVATATTKVFLFGTMSSASPGRSAGIIDSVQTAVVSIPAGVFVNYTSQSVVGDPAHTFRLRSGVMVPSGPVQVPAASITALYNTVTRDLTFTLLNSGGTANLAADTTSNANKGAEVATINFTHTAGLTPAMPTTATATAVQQFRTIGGPSIDSLNGCTVNFLTTYQ